MGVMLRVPQSAQSVPYTQSETLLLAPSWHVPSCANAHVFKHVGPGLGCLLGPQSWQSLPKSHTCFCEAVDSSLQTPLKAHAHVLVQNVPAKEEGEDKARVSLPPSLCAGGTPRAYGCDQERAHERREQRAGARGHLGVRPQKDAFLAARLPARPAPARATGDSR